MKVSDLKNIYAFIRHSGIHPEPEKLTLMELQALALNPALSEKLAVLCTDKNLYQELEMDSPYVDTHMDVSYTPARLQLHSHSFFEIIYCKNGNIQYLIGCRRYCIHSGDIILIPPGISHRPLFYDIMEEPYSRIVLWISAEFLRGLTDFCPQELLAQTRKQERFLLQTKDSPFDYLGAYFKQGLLEASERAPMWEIALYSNTATLLAHLTRALLSTQGNFPMEKPSLSDQIVSYIENHYADKISLEKTAEAFHISASTLGKLFYQNLGISFYHFVTKRRLIHAKIKIEEGRSMEEAALACGFCDYSAFYRAFKKEYGISPREYRRLVARNQFFGNSSQ